MKTTLGDRLLDAVAGTPLAERLRATLSDLVERRGGDAAAARVDGWPLLGLARVLATQPAVGGFLSHRPELFERIATADPEALAARERALEDPARIFDGDEDLETALDDLRLLRRDETCYAACFDLAGAVAFEVISDFLSVVAESITERALRLAQSTAAPDSDGKLLAVIGMGKIAGREFTYHSDLDLIFLYPGEAAEIDRASRVGQRLVTYLTTMTGAGIAYAVDTRLRPSGRQGMLVSAYDAYERYQRDAAQTWEHLALLRARAIAGDTARARETLERVRGHVLSLGVDPWPYLVELRDRVVAERTGDGEDVCFKTGAGGLMDVDFLAGGGLLERGAELPPLPSVSGMLRATATGKRVEALLADYRFLRIVEARARWIAGRGVEELRTDDEALPALAELIETGLEPAALLERVAAVRRRVRAAYASVVEAGSISALAD